MDKKTIYIPVDETEDGQTIYEPVRERKIRFWFYPVDWQGGLFYFTRSLWSFDLEGNLILWLIINLLRVIPLTAVALILDLVLLLLILLFWLLKRLLIEIIRLLTDLIRLIFAKVLGLLGFWLGFAGIIIILMILFLRFNEIKGLILNLLSNAGF